MKRIVNNDKEINVSISMQNCLCSTQQINEEVMYSLNISEVWLEESSAVLVN